MALQWTPLRAQSQPNSISRARRSVAHLEHRTHSKVLHTYKLMVSGDGGPPNRTDSPFTQLRPRNKMTDRAVQCDSVMSEPEPFDNSPLPEPLLDNSPPPEPNCTVAEINTPESTPNVTPTRPLSVEFTNSLGRERRKTINENVNEILVQPVNSEDKTDSEPKVLLVENTTGFVDVNNGERQDSRCVDCIYFSMKCCECTIM